MSTMQNGILEDLGAVIGFEATDRLVGWRDGVNLYIPNQAARDHELCAVLGAGDRDAGYRLMQRLCADFGGEILCMPKGGQREYMRKVARIRRYLAKGVSVRCVAHAVGMTERQVINQRRWLEQNGLLPYILRELPTREQMELLFEPGAHARSVR